MQCQYQKANHHYCYSLYVMFVLIDYRKCNVSEEFLKKQIRHDKCLDCCFQMVCKEYYK